MTISIDHERHSPSLRPLSIGEILDRAIDISVRNWISLSAILLIYLVPAQILSNALNPNSPDIFATFGHPSHRAASHAPASPNYWFHVSTVIMILIQQVANGAVILAIGAILDKRRLTFGQVYAAAWRRWPSLIAFTLSATGAIVAIGIGVALPAIVAVTIARAIFGPHYYGIEVSIPLLVAIVPLVLCCGLVFAELVMAFRALLLENVSIAMAIRLSTKRIFANGMRRRTAVMMFALASALVVVIALNITARHLLLFGTIHSQVATLVVSCLNAAVFGVFSSVAVTLFYYDARIRIEGFDLTLLARAQDVAD